MEIRTAFHKRLREIQDEVLAMGSMVEKANSRSIEALKERDLDKAHEIIADDLKINKKRFNIEQKCVQLIATQQPVASDLRTLASVLLLISELERIGDYAKGIAKISLMIGTEPLLKPLVDLPRMADKVSDMLHRALVAFVERDTEVAKRLPDEDDEVDSLYEQTYRELVTYIIADPRNINQANLLLWVAHNLERAGDRVTNICERVLFTVTGTMEEMDAEAWEVKGMKGI